MVKLREIYNPKAIKFRKTLNARLNEPAVNEKLTRKRRRTLIIITKHNNNDLYNKTAIKIKFQVFQNPLSVEREIYG